MRKAGERLKEYFRETTLANNRTYPIGTGEFGVVYDSDVPGNVMKQVTYPDYQNDISNEANLQAIAAEMGIAPRIAGVETFPGGIGNRIEMSDVRTNFEPHWDDSQFPSGRDAVRVNQQLGAPELCRYRRATVYDLLEGGDVGDAMDVAKQGFSRLQKIK